MEKLSSRVVELEMKISELESMNDELSEAMLEQWKIINLQGNSLRSLTNRLLKIEEAQTRDIRVDKPPHW